MILYMFPQLKIEFTKDGNVDVKSASSAGLRWYFRFEYTTIYRVDEDEDDVSHLYIPLPRLMYICISLIILMHVCLQTRTGSLGYLRVLH